ncbi:nucleoside triphosphate pyrophosphohydrolase [bacterium]|nr:nucleoside triphosphate pyrophosphohydrolase [bacterium]
MTKPAAAPLPASPAIDRLLEIMVRLRTPVTGCPWDLEQDFASIAPYTIEEAYEVADAIERGDMEHLKEELGDLLLQVVFHAQMAKEEKLFDFDDVAGSISDKMVERHPHVFGGAEMNQKLGEADIKTADAQLTAWEDMKKAKREQQNPDASALDGVTLGLPALMRAEKLQKRAAKTGFDWPSIAPVWDKLHEELDELKEAASRPNNQAHIEEEFGDLMFVMANLARHLKLDPETALKNANSKFERRFRQMEQFAKTNGKTFSKLSLVEQEALWQQAKQLEKK